MPEYLSPGVYVEEIDLRSRPIEGVGTSTAGLVGQTERGPITPQLITSTTEYGQVFGGPIDQSFLGHAIDGFFRNGGRRCFVARVVGAGATSASLDLGTVRAETVGPGSWGNNVFVTVEDGSLFQETVRPDPFKLTVYYWRTLPPSAEDGQAGPIVDPGDPRNRTNPKSRPADVVEVYDNLSSDPASPDFYARRVNGISRLVTLVREAPGRPPTQGRAALATLNGAGRPGDTLDKHLANGAGGAAPALSDYRGSQITDPGSPIFGARTALAAFEDIDEITLVGIPDEHAVAGLTDELIDHCEKLRDRFAVTAAPPGSVNVAQLRPPRDSKYAAVYYPWIKVLDPTSGLPRLVPPTGHVLGIYVRSDVERGVHKAPANEVVRGAVDLELSVGAAQQDLLNPRGVNVIRAFPGRGILVWGARTMSTDSEWRYVNVRRLFNFLEESIDEGTQFAVFEPNDVSLWERLRGSVSAFLTTQWRAGMLQGTRPEEAFFVKVGLGETMTQDDIDNGRVTVMIGIAPVKPAEFVIFRITQMPGGAGVSE
ncbi:MAG: phage tail sheath subtilisin-like domain-containing protein [Chloroflexota bacterium]